MCSEEEHLHLLVNNAGVNMCPEDRSADKFELQFAVNYLGKKNMHCFSILFILSFLFVFIWFIFVSYPCTFFFFPFCFLFVGCCYKSSFVLILINFVILFVHTCVICVCVCVVVWVIQGSLS